MHKAWVYDFDGTIYDGDSSIDFFKFCIKKNKRVLFYLPKIFLFTVLYLFRIIDVKTYKEKFFSYLRLFDNIDSLVDEFWKNYNKKINQFFLDDVLKNDAKIYVVSASFDFLLNGYLKQFSNVNLIATNYNLNTYKIEGENCRGKEKINRLNKCDKKIKVEKFYSDSFHDIYLAQKAKQAYLVDKGNVEPWNEQKLESKKNRKTAFVLFLIFFVFYLFLGIFLSYHYDFKNNYDLLFDSDTARVISDFSNILGDHYRIKVHPLYVILVQPIILLLNSITMDSMLSLIIFSSAVSALSVVLVYLIGSIFTNNYKVKILVSLIFGFAFTNFIYSAGIEVYNVASLFLLLLWYHVIRIFKAETISKKDMWILVLLGITSVAFTITNYFIFLIVSLVLLLSRKIKFSKLLGINVLVVILVVFLSYFQNLVWNNTSLVYKFDDNFKEEESYTNYNVTFDKAKEVLKNSYINPLVSSEITLNNYEVEGDILSFGKTSPLSIVVFCVFYGLILYFVVKYFKKNLLLNVGVILALCFNTCLHLVYGSNSFLYSCHFLYLPFLLFFINYNDFKNFKFQKAFLVLLGLIVLCEFFVNINHFRDILSFVKTILMPNYFRANCGTIKLFLMISFIIFISFILLYLFYKNIRKLKRDNLFCPIFNCVVCFIMLQCLFIGVLTAPQYGKFLGFSLGSNSPTNENEFAIETKKVSEDLKSNFEDECQDYLNYELEYKRFAQNYPIKIVDIGEDNYYFFGMGNRKKILFKDGKLIDLDNKNILYEWDVKEYLIIPNEYTIILSTNQGDYIKIYENEDGVFIQENGNDLIEGTDIHINLENFEGQEYQNIKKVLYGEILFNIKDSTPYPNIIVYDEPWYRDGAMVAMVLNQTNNANLIEDWISSIDDVYDLQNGNNEEPDNLGELLYIISVSSDSHDELVSKIIEEAKKVASNNSDGYYLHGFTDGSYHDVYQNKWYNFGLKSLKMDGKFKYDDVEDSYDAFTWWNDKNSDVYFDNNVSELYPYLSLAQYHKSGKGIIFLNRYLYPLSYEKEGSEANYEKMNVVDEYYVTNKISPTHTWTASEFLLFLLDETGNLK